MRSLAAKNVKAKLICRGTNQGTPEHPKVPAVSYYWGLSATPEAFDAMVEQMASRRMDRAAQHGGWLQHWNTVKESTKEQWREFARFDLKNIGITTPAAQGRRAQR